MPLSFRDTMKRKMDQAESHLDKACEILQEIASVYAEDHPEITAQYKDTWLFLQQGKVIIQMLRRNY